MDLKLHSLHGDAGLKPFSGLALPTPAASAVAVGTRIEREADGFHSLPQAILCFIDFYLVCGESFISPKECNLAAGGWLRLDGTPDLQCVC